MMGALALRASIGGGAKTQTAVGAGVGTVIGNMTNGGGNAAAFDGTTSQINALSAIGGVDAANVYVGKDWGSGNTKFISGLEIWGPSNVGVNGTTGGTVTIKLQGSTDNFSSSTIDLGSNSFTSVGADEHKTWLSGFTATTAYRYHRALITTVPGSGVSNCLAEVKFYEDV